MLRLSVLASLLLIAAVMIKSNFNSTSASAQPIKLSGFSISKEKKSKPIEQRRSIAVEKKKQTTSQKPQKIAVQPAKKIKPPIEELTEVQKIARTKQAWENVRAKAFDRLRIGATTREIIDQLREDFERRNDPLAYTDYLQNLKEVLGERDFDFLWRAREQFKLRVQQRAKFDSGPYLGHL